MAKQAYIYRVNDANNGSEITVKAKSVAHAASLARKAIAASLGKKFRPWVSDKATGGWVGIGIDMPTCNHVQVPRPTPRPESKKKLWKQRAST